MKNFTPILFFFAILQIAAALPAKSEIVNRKSEVPQPPRWEKLGERKVNYALDRDEIMVTASEGRITALKIMVKKGGINLRKMVVHFADGSTQELELRNELRAGRESRVMDLTGKRRVISKVVFWYDTKNISIKKAEVELWGRH